MREKLGINDSCWCILRTAGKSTLALAQSLREDGFEVWTPIETRTICIPRANVKRDVRLPLLAGFVFARSRHLFDLLGLAAFPMRRGPGGRMPAHDRFSLFHALGGEGIHMVDDRALEPLRSAENRIVPLRRQKVYGKGSTVRVAEGCYEGMIGRVEDSKRGKTIVFFGGTSPLANVKLPTSILRLDEVSALHPAMGVAALAA